MRRFTHRQAFMFLALLLGALMAAVLWHYHGKLDDINKKIEQLEEAER